MKSHGPQDAITPLKDEGFTSQEGFLGQEGGVGMTSLWCVQPRALGVASGRAGPSLAVCPCPLEPFLSSRLSGQSEDPELFSGQYGPVLLEKPEDLPLWGSFWQPPAFPVDQLRGEKVPLPVLASD